MFIEYISTDLRKSSKNLNNTEIFLERLKSMVGLKTDHELALRLGYKSTGTISMWKKNNRPDYDRVLNTFKNINLSYLIYGRGPKYINDAAGGGDEDVNQMISEVNDLITEYRHQGDQLISMPLSQDAALELLRSSIKLIEAYIHAAEEAQRLNDDDVS